jgi:hypothetical protein
MPQSTLQRLINHLYDAFTQLEITVPARDVEQIAFLIHHAMDGERRKYHTAHHVLQVCESLGAVETLAALFHDVIYMQVDHGFPRQTEPLLSRFVGVQDSGVCIKDDDEVRNDPLFQLCLDVFGFHVGQTWSLFSGPNELLSAFVAAKALAPYLPLQTLLAVIACIEGTIPFRNVDAHGHTCFDLLSQRLSQISARDHLGLTVADVDAMVASAVTVANNDVQGFAETDTGEFLDNTWLLLPETHGTLWSVETYSMGSYRQAIMKTESFLSALDHHSIFGRYKDVPDAAHFNSLLWQAEKNLTIAREYLGIKLLSIAVLEALALSTGGDVPVAMFMGDLRRGEQDVVRAEDYLPAVTVAPDESYDATLLTLFEAGRTSESSFDMKASPLSLYLYKSLGGTQSKQLLCYARAMFAGQLSPRDFLAKLDKGVLGSIAQACAMIATTRRDALLALA